MNTSCTGGETEAWAVRHFAQGDSETMQTLLASKPRFLVSAAALWGRNEAQGLTDSKDKRNYSQPRSRLLTTLKQEHAEEEGRASPSPVSTFTSVRWWNKPVLTLSGILDTALKKDLRKA